MALPCSAAARLLVAAPVPTMESLYGVGGASLHADAFTLADQVELLGQARFGRRGLMGA